MIQLFRYDDADTTNMTCAFTVIPTSRDGMSGSMDRCFGMVTEWEQSSGKLHLQILGTNHMYNVTLKNSPIQCFL